MLNFCFTTLKSYLESTDYGECKVGWDLGDFTICLMLEYDSCVMAAMPTKSKRRVWTLIQDAVM